MAQAREFPVEFPVEVLAGVLAFWLEVLAYSICSTLFHSTPGAGTLLGVLHPSTLNLIVFVDTSCPYVIPPCITNVIVILGVWNNILLFLLTQIFYYKFITLVIIFDDLSYIIYFFDIDLRICLFSSKYILIES